MVVCDKQPHPLHFVWAFLLAGLVRSLTSSACEGSRDAWLWLQLCAASGAVDLLSYNLFVLLAANALHSVHGLAFAWLVCFACTYPLRLLAARCASGAHQSRALRTLLLIPSSWLIATSAALSSLCIYLLVTLLLKQELQERGAALDSARYGWHVATFFMGVVFAPLCALRAPGDGGGRGGAPATLHAVVGGLATQPSPATPLACSVVVLAALGVLPNRPYQACLQSRSPACRALMLQFACAAALAAYLCLVRVLVAPASTVGPFLCGCDDSLRAGSAETEQHLLDIERLPDTERFLDMERIQLGRGWSLLGLMYGRRAVNVPSRRACKETSHRMASHGNASSVGSSRGLVLTADGSSSKYADAVYVCLHGVRKLHQSRIRAEVFFVGAAERFSVEAAGRILSLGEVQILDLLQSIAAPLRQLVLC